MEALEKARDERPDLVITDILMPNMDGVEFARLLRASAGLARVPIIFYTATYRLQEAYAMIQSCEESVVLPKPSEPEKILEAVNKFLGLAAPAAEPATPAAGGERDPHLVHLHELSLKMNSLIKEALGVREDALEGFGHSLHDMQRLSLRLSNLVEVGMDLAGQRDPQQVLHTLCYAARNLVTARYAVLGVLEEGGEFHLITKGLRRKEAAVFHGLDPRVGVLGQLLEEGLPLRFQGKEAQELEGGGQLKVKRRTGQ